MIPILIAVVYFGFFSVLFGFMARRKAAKAAAGDAGQGKNFFTASGQLGFLAFMCVFTLAPLGGGHTTALFESQAGFGVAAAWWGILAGGVFVPIFLLWFAPWFKKLNALKGVVTFPQGLGRIFGPKIKIYNTSVAPAAWMAIAISELLGTATCIYTLAGGQLAFSPWCVLIAGILMLIYVLFGGMLQASYMGVINAFVLVIGAYVAVAFAAHSYDGGAAGVTASYALQDMAWHTNLFHLTPQVMMNVALPVVILHVLAVSSEHVMYQPVLGAKNNKTMRRSAFPGGLLNTACCLPFVMLGVIGTSIASIAAKEPILSVPELALLMFPKALIGLLMVALLCALLSTGSGLILSVSHVLADDIIGPAINKKPGDKGYVALSRILIVVVTLALLLPAMRMNALLITLFFWSFSLSMPIMFNYLLGMTWKINRKAAWITLICATAVNFWWTFATPDWAGLFTLSFWPVAFVTVGLGLILNAIMPGEPGMLRQMKEIEKEILAKKS